MKDIKYINHIVRNVIIYVIFLCYAGTYIGRFPDISTFLFGLVAYVLAYTPIYFFNDFMDYKEDSVYGKANLYNAIANKQWYWWCAIILLVSGSSFLWYLSYQAFILLLVLYLFNIAYTFPPFRARDIPYVREIIMLLIYTTKVYLFSELLFGTPFILPLLVALFIGATGGVSISIYKRYYKRVLGTELLFGLFFIFLWGAVVWNYPELRLYFIPMIPTVGVVALLYKDKPVPSGILQVLYLIYVLAVFFLG